MAAVDPESLDTLYAELTLVLSQRTEVLKTLPKATEDIGPKTVAYVNAYSTLRALNEQEKYLRRRIRLLENQGGTIIMTAVPMN